MNVLGDEVAHTVYVFTLITFFCVRQFNQLTLILSMVLALSVFQCSGVFVLDILDIFDIWVFPFGILSVSFIWTHSSLGFPGFGCLFVLFVFVPAPISFHIIVFDLRFIHFSMIHLFGLFID